ncbi:MAG: caspase domain-containing protein [Sandaracinaceae bacterium]
MARNDEDHAIVVGIDRYSFGDLNPLAGARADATDFQAWLIEQGPTGGGLDEKHVTLLAGKDDGSAPTAENIRKAFTDLLRTKIPVGTKRIGRRLYVFMSGHGASLESASVTSVGLLPAPFDELENFYVVGQLFVEAVQKRGAFDEILLFMDCCRDLAPMPLSVLLPGFDATVGAVPPKVATLTAYAAQWGSKARERDFTANGTTRKRGIFTAALIEALRGWAIDEDTGHVTKDSLERYLLSRIAYYRPDGSEQKPDVTGPRDLVIVPTPSAPRETELILVLPSPGPAQVVVQTAVAGSERTFDVPPGETEVRTKVQGLKRWLVSRDGNPPMSVHVAGEEQRVNIV